MSSELESLGVGEAKASLSELLNRVERRHQVVTITRHGKPVARLVPVELVAGPPHLADARGWVEDADPFFRQLDRVVRARARHRPRGLRSLS